MPLFCNWYSGIAWYFSNSDCHAASDIGGRAPVTGFHSVIDRPESVSRVSPPTSTIAATIAAMTSSHAAIMRRDRRRRASAAPGAGAAGRAAPGVVSSKIARGLLMGSLHWVSRRGLSAPAAPRPAP